MSTTVTLTCDNCGHVGTNHTQDWYHLEAVPRTGSLVAMPGPFDYCSGVCLAEHVASRFSAQAEEPEKPSGAGWARPLGARKWHYFWGGAGLSLCWRGYWTGERTAREQNSPDNCELCARKLEKQP